MPRKKFKLLGLPPEIRYQIYKYALVCDRKYVQICPIYSGPPSTIAKLRNSRRFSSENVFQKGLILSCRQVNNEAWAIFFRHNGFEFACPSTMHDFLRGIGKALRWQIQKIKVCVRGFPPSKDRQTFNIIGTCVRRGQLKHLELVMENRATRMMYMSSQSHAHQSYLKYITAGVMGLETVELKMRSGMNSHNPFGIWIDKKAMAEVVEAVRKSMLQPFPPITRKWTPARFPKSKQNMKGSPAQNLRKQKSRSHIPRSI